jgi:hypothetical protein
VVELVFVPILRLASMKPPRVAKCFRKGCSLSTGWHKFWTATILLDTPVGPQFIANAYLRGWMDFTLDLFVVV